MSVSKLAIDGGRPVHAGKPIPLAKVSWDEREQIFRMSSRIVKTFSVSKAAYGYSEKTERRKWTTVVSAAVFIL